MDGESEPSPEIRIFSMQWSRHCSPAAEPNHDRRVLL